MVDQIVPIENGDFVVVSQSTVDVVTLGVSEREVVELGDDLYAVEPSLGIYAVMD